MATDLDAALARLEAALWAYGLDFPRLPAELRRLAGW
jgi:hypothetical protein